MFPARALSSHQNKPCGAAPPPRPLVPARSTLGGCPGNVAPTSARATLYDVVVLRVVPRCQTFAALVVPSGLWTWI